MRFFFILRQFCLKWKLYLFPIVNFIFALSSNFVVCNLYQYLCSKPQKGCFKHQNPFSIWWTIYGLNNKSGLKISIWCLIKQKKKLFEHHLKTTVPVREPDVNDLSEIPMISDFKHSLYLLNRHLCLCFQHQNWCSTQPIGELKPKQIQCSKHKNSDPLTNFGV